MADGKVRRFASILKRKRTVTPEELENSNFKRCLTHWDLTALGVGSTLGVGVYVIVGAVALQLAGPSIVVSFLIAAVASMFAGLCYAEFGSRVPKAGSSYIYTYVTIGEFVAFMVGWNVILEATFGCASVARGLSTYVDSLANATISNWSQSVVPIDTTFLSSYFDFVAFALVLVFGVILSLGVRQSSSVNIVLSAVNILVILFIIIVGAFKADPNNWYLTAEAVPISGGEGGFFPYGWLGTLQGAAVCFYGFVGFDAINSSAEEVKRPRRNIPIAIITVICISFVCYASVATVVTMMMPYYLQDSVGAVASSFTYVGLEWAQCFVSIGAIFGISSSLFGAMFPLTRLLHAMASDGLIFHGLAAVSKWKSPIVATLLSTAVIAILAAIFELHQLVMMMCIGTLLSYTVVAACVIIQRYSSSTILESPAGYLRQICGVGDKTASERSSRVVEIMLVMYVAVCVALALIHILVDQALIPSAILHSVALMLLVLMALQPTTKEEIPFKTPLVPLIPALSIYVNVHLLILINLQTWFRVLIGMLIGIPIYLFSICCYSRKKMGQLEENIRSQSFSNQNGKTVQSGAESTILPDIVITTETHEHNKQNTTNIVNEELIMKYEASPIILRIEEDILVQQAIIDHNDREAKIIDLLDQVIQAEEDSYGELISLNGQKDYMNEEENIKENQESTVILSTEPEVIPHRQSLSELSDAGSDASLGNPVLSKYDVIAQVHREDLPKVTEENYENDEVDSQEEQDENEKVTFFNESETNSQTDESGYFDTLDRNLLIESAEDTMSDVPYIPKPPPMDESYFATPVKSYTIIVSKPDDAILTNKDKKSDPNEPYIPVPPPMDESYFASPYKGYRAEENGLVYPDEIEENLQDPFSPSIPLVDSNQLPSNFKKSYTIASRSPCPKSMEEGEENKPRESINSNSSVDEDNIVFGSKRQVNFMSKLNNIFQAKAVPPVENESDEPRKRSNSTGDVVESEVIALSRDRPAVFLDLKKELLSKHSSNQRHNTNTNESKDEINSDKEDDDEDKEESLSRDDLKTKLESIFAAGGPKLLKPRLMKSSTLTPEENAVETSSEITTKLPKMEINDTLKRQKDKFGAVLNSFRLSYNKDDEPV